jgi:2-phosphoglycolate phosphatase
MLISTTTGAPLCPPKAVLFDLDGTLVDTADDLGAALNFVLVKHGLPAVAEDLYRPMASHGAKGLLELGFGAALKEYPFTLLRNELLDYYQQHLTVHSQLFGGAAEFLPLLKAQNIRWGIVTNKPYKLAAAMLRQMSGMEDCQILLGGDSLHQRKPSPVPLWVAAHKMGVAAADCWYIGDAERDIEAANRAGMTSIIADYGFISESDTPELWGADCRVQHLMMLEAFLAAR